MSYRVLIVDDEEYILGGIKKIVEETGIFVAVDTQLNPLLAEKMYRKNPYDLVITDIRMEEEDGFDLIEHVTPPMLECNYNTKFVILTAYYDYEFMHKALKLGVDDYILKPINKAAFIGCLRKMKAELDEFYEAENSKVLPTAVKEENGGTFVNEEIRTGKMRVALEYIDRHIDSKLDLAYVANLVDLNYFYFSRNFKKETGMSFLDYVTEKRMLRAIELLGDYTLKVYEIARMLGYEDDKHFFKIFKKRFGVSPQKFRDDIRN